MNMDLRRMMGTLSLAATLLAGCIENPGPDPDLLKPKPERAIQTLYMLDGVLEFRFERLEGRTTLRVTNISAATLDTGVCLVRMWRYGVPRNEYRGLFPKPLLQFTARLPALRTRDWADLGTVDTTLDLRLDELESDLRGIHMVWEDEEPSHPLAGTYAGTWTATDTAGQAHRGTVHGILDADGLYVLGLGDTVRTTPLAKLSGLAQHDGSFRSGPEYNEFRPPYGQASLAGAFTRRDGRLLAAFGPRAGRPWFDSLHLDLEPVPLP